MKEEVICLRIVPIKGIGALNEARMDWRHTSRRQETHLFAELVTEDEAHTNSFIQSLSLSFSPKNEWILEVQIPRINEFSSLLFPLRKKIWPKDHYRLHHSPFSSSVKRNWNQLSQESIHLVWILPLYCTRRQVHTKDDTHTIAVPGSTCIEGESLWPKTSRVKNILATSDFNSVINDVPRIGSHSEYFLREIERERGEGKLHRDQRPKNIRS